MMIPVEEAHFSGSWLSEYVRMRHGDEVEEARLNSQMNSRQSGKFHKRGK